MPNKLEQIAIAARAALIGPNTYKEDFTSINPDDMYSPTHTRALADTKTPVYGKGTGNYLDTANYNAGGSIDIYGDPNVMGTGRVAALNLNLATNGYDPNNNYTTPDTSKNLGQVHIP